MQGVDIRADCTAQHAADLFSGVLEDGRLAKQTAGSFRRVAAGKVAGIQALDCQLSNAPTRGVVAFSSVSSIVAPLGQPNYASANASLCAWASAKAAQGKQDGSSCFFSRS
jgi:KR domain